MILIFCFSYFDALPIVVLRVVDKLNEDLEVKKGQTPKSDIPPNITPKVVTPEIYLQICDSSATLIGPLGIVTLFDAVLGGIPLSGVYH